MTKLGGTERTLLWVSITVLGLSLKFLYGGDLGDLNPGDLNLGGETQAELVNLLTEPKILFYLPFDGSSTARTETVYVSGPVVPVYEKGLVGQAASLGKIKAYYPIHGHLDSHRGAISFWMKLSPDEMGNRPYATPIQIDDFYAIPPRASWLVKWYEEKDKWHHLVITWKPVSPVAREVNIYLDTQKICTDSFEPAVEEPEWMRLSHAFWAWVDEFYIWNSALDEKEIKKAYARTLEGKTSWPEEMIPTPRFTGGMPDLSGVDSARPPLPKEVDWSEAGAYQEKTPTRHRICLNGYWRFQATRHISDPMSPTNWWYTRIPGLWMAKDQESGAPLYGMYEEKFGKFETVEGTGTPPCRRFHGLPLTGHCPVYLERDVTIPSGWRDRRLFIHYDGYHLSGLNAFYFNGRHIGSAAGWRDTFFGITNALPPASTHRLLLFMNGGSSVIRDLWLEARNYREAMLEDIFLMPSYRKKTLTLRCRFRNFTGSAIPLEVSADIIEAEDRKTVAKSFPKSKVVLSGKGMEQHDVVYPWEDPHCWEPEDPHLYYAVVRLHDGNSRLADEAYPIRFGFRELYTQDGFFMLNGHKFVPNGFANQQVLKDSFYPDEYWRYGVSMLIDQLKAVHHNLSRLWNTGFNHRALFDIADEKGLLFFPFAPPLTPRAVRWTTEEEMKAQVEDWLESYRYLLMDYKNHPSFVGVAYDRVSANGVVMSGFNFPYNLDESYTERLMKNNELVRKQRKMIDLALRRVAEEIDPSRLVFSHRSMFHGPVQGDSTEYQGFGTPLQEREELYSTWHTTHVRPHWIYETGFPVAALDWLDISGKKSYLMPPDLGIAGLICVEYGSIYFGDKAYEIEDKSFCDGLMRVMSRSQNVQKGSIYSMLDNSRNRIEINKLFVRNVIRSFRYYEGVAYNPHAQLAYWVIPAYASAGTTGPDPKKLRMPGLRSDKSGYGPNPTPIKLSEVGEVVEKANRPVMAFIAGKPGEWATKDHAFFSGEDIEKGVLVFNSRLEPLEGEVSWKLCRRDSDETIRQGAIPAHIPAWEKAHLALRFQAPAVEKKTKYRIEVECRQGGKVLTDDTFDIEVFPAHNRLPAPKALMGLLDPMGDTKQMLDKAGVGYEMIAEGSDLSRLKALIIGRKCLDQKGRDLLQRLDINGAVRKGLHVLIFEQVPEPVGEDEKKKGFPLFLEDTPSRKEKSVLGLRSDERRSRYCFIRDSGHPLFEGLENEDFANWRGATDLHEAYPPAPPEVEACFKGLSRFPRWSNNGIVAFYQVEKPQYGNYKALMDCEYDLWLSPLLEMNMEKGKVVLSLLEVTNRYGKDPVATMLVDRLIRYMAEAKSVPRVNTGFFGDKSYEELMDTLQLDYAKIDDVSGGLKGIELLVVGLGKMKKSEGLKRPGADAPTGAELDLQAGTTEIGKSKGDTSDIDEFLKVISEKKSPPKEPELLRQIKVLEEAKQALSAFVNKGGTILVLPVQDSQELGWLPVNVGLKKRGVYEAALPNSPGLLAGLGISDFWWRGVWDMTVIDRLPASSYATDPGLVGVIEFGKGRIVLCQIHPFMIGDDRYFGKSARVISTMLNNLGARFRQSPDLTAKAYHEHKFPYLRRTIDFDPYRHHYW